MLEVSELLRHASKEDSDTKSDESLINKIARQSITENRKNGDTLLSSGLAPESSTARYSIATVKGIAYLPEGIWESTIHNLNNPLEAATTFGMGAGMALVLKTVLPEGGLAGKLAGAAIGAYFTYKAAQPIAEAYKSAGSARTFSELDAASRQIGKTGGAFIVDSTIAAAGYKIGAHYTGKVLSSQALDGFADAKANFYSKLSEQGSRALEQIMPTGASAGSAPNNSVSRSFMAADRNMSTAKFIGKLDPQVKMDVSVLLKSEASELKIQRTLARIAQGRQKPLSDAQIAEHFSASPDTVSKLSRFAGEHGLSIKEADINSGRIVLTGTSNDFAAAFKTRLNVYQTLNGEQFIGREGGMEIPAELAGKVTGVLGLDTRPQAKPHFQLLNESGSTRSSAIAGRRGYMPNEVADAYNFPKDSLGQGQNVAIIQLGGGMDRADNARYYQSRSLPEPKINIIEVGEAKNSPGHAFDSEVMLDSQVIGTVAPRASQNIIFAANSEKGFVDAILRATFPEAKEGKNSVISISWGLNEEGWSKQGIQSMNEAFKKAALKGISIFASAGDDGARDRATNGRLQAHYPASDPYVTGNGGTRLILDEGGKIRAEHVWNNGGRNDAGGGGISEIFPPQDFQKGVNVPANANSGKFGRGVPDIAANADPVTGYIIRVHGNETIMGGTSAVAPLHAALMLRVNGSLGKAFGTPLNPWLYENSRSGIFNDITVGDNGGYKAGPGWDAASGLGSIDGSKLLAQMKANPYLGSRFGELRFVGPAQTGSDSNSQ